MSLSPFPWGYRMRINPQPLLRVSRILLQLLKLCIPWRIFPIPPAPAVTVISSIRKGERGRCPVMIVLRLVRCPGFNFIAPGSCLYLVITFKMCSHGPEIMRRRLQRHLDLMRRLGDSLSLVDARSLLHLPPPNLCTPDSQIIGDICTKTG